VDNLPELFAERLLQLRTEKRLSQEALASRADLKQAFVSQVENVRQEPGLTTIGKLAKGLGVEPVELFCFQRVDGSEAEQMKAETDLLVKLLNGTDLKTVRRVRRVTEAMLLE